MNIGIDLMGGDFAPKESIKGIQSYLQSEKKVGELHFMLLGREADVKAYLPMLEDYKERYTFIPCEEVIEMNEHPTKALKTKPKSSIAIGFGLLKSEKMDAFISAGNTGAMMVGALYSVKAIPGVLRPTIASPLPKLNGGFNFVLDVGANSDCKPEHLVQFAQMGVLYSRHVLKLNNPRVALLNIGEEEGKGNLLTQATYPLLANDSRITFIGNKEGRDLFLDDADVFVCEGFTGNVVLKMTESIYHIFKHDRKIDDAFLDQLNYEIYGGTPILGINAPVIIGHGISHAPAFHTMISTASKMVSSGLISILQENFTQE